MNPITFLIQFVLVHHQSLGYLKSQTITGQEHFDGFHSNELNLFGARMTNFTTSGLHSTVANDVIVPPLLFLVFILVGEYVLRIWLLLYSRFSKRVGLLVVRALFDVANVMIVTLF